MKNYSAKIFSIIMTGTLVVLPFGVHADDGGYNWAYDDNSASVSDTSGGYNWAYDDNSASQTDTSSGYNWAYDDNSSSYANPSTGYNWAYDDNSLSAGGYTLSDGSFTTSNPNNFSDGSFTTSNPYNLSDGSYVLDNVSDGSYTLDNNLSSGSYTLGNNLSDGSYTLDNNLSDGSYTLDNQNLSQHGDYVVENLSDGSYVVSGPSTRLSDGSYTLDGQPNAQYNAALSAEYGYPCYTMPSYGSYNSYSTGTLYGYNSYTAPRQQAPYFTSTPYYTTPTYRAPVVAGCTYGCAPAAVAYQYGYNKVISQPAYYPQQNYTVGYNNTGYNVHPVVYANNAPQAPYITLNQVPYTGLDLGPVGLVVYYSFLALTAMLGYYLIVVKKIQNTLVRRALKRTA
jgi:hypothetical protein